MSLKSPTKKMSKSDPLPLSKIMLDDHPDQILLKIKSAVTDGLKGITFDPIQRPGTTLDTYCFSLSSNLLTSASINQKNKTKKRPLQSDGNLRRPLGKLHRND
eukprot:Sdes_comp20718_c0_seq2m16438